VAIQHVANGVVERPVRIVLLPIRPNLALMDIPHRF
jgi:hypothetical protein